MSNENRPPAEIVRGLRLLCLYAGVKVLLMGLKLISQVMDGSWAEWSDKLKHDSPALEHLMTFHALTVFALTIGFYALVILKLRQGRNWARYLVTAVFITTFAYDFAVRVIAASTDGFALSPPAVIWAVLMAVHGYAVYLFFTKQSGMWFASAVSRKQ